MSVAEDLSRTESEASFVLVDGEKRRVSSASSSSFAGEHEHPSAAPGYRPGAVPSYAHDWTGAGLKKHGRHFVDKYGRVCNLRGVNVSGACKMPVNHDHEIFPADAETVTFVGRPFPLDEAPEHFARLRRWGFNFIRFLVTWEAVEHAGLGQYDTEYLEYLREILSMLPQYGMIAFVALHQDVWSRYSGGSGAPAWTLESVGFDLHKLEETHAAWLKGVKGGGHTEEERGLWPCGYQKLTASTMATCFWAGDIFAPKLRLKNKHGVEVGIQEYLQGAFLDMFAELARATGDLEGVVGFEMMNEPHRGYVELQSLHAFDYNTDLHLGSIPTAFESFQLGAGYPTEVATWTRSFPFPTRKSGRAMLNPHGSKVWRPDGPTLGLCIWEMHGVWGYDVKKKEAVVLRESYFVNHSTGANRVDWYTDCFYPLIKKWEKTVRSIVAPEKFLFLEPIPNEFCPPSFTTDRQVSNMVYAPHWYDLKGLFDKAFSDFTVNVQGLSRGMFPLKGLYWGQSGARENFALQIRNIVEHGYKSLGEIPVILGECGIPMDMNKGDAFTTDDWTWQSRMMDAMMTGLERALVGFTLWNYNPLNADDIGDEWNGENFSWFSKRRALPAIMLDFEQDATGLDQGGRILEAVVRPYAAKTAGVPLAFEYEMNTGAFKFEWANPGGNDMGSADVAKPPLGGHPELTAWETEIFVPSMVTKGRRVIVRALQDKDLWTYDEKRQTLFIVVADRTPGVRHTVRFDVVPRLEGVFEVNDFWSDWKHSIISFIGMLVCIIAYRLAA